MKDNHIVKLLNKYSNGSIENKPKSIDSRKKHYVLRPNNMHLNS